MGRFQVIEFLINFHAIKTVNLLSKTYHNSKLPKEITEGMVRIIFNFRVKKHHNFLGFWSYPSIFGVHRAYQRCFQKKINNFDETFFCDEKSQLWIKITKGGSGYHEVKQFASVSKPSQNFLLPEVRRDFWQVVVLLII